MIMTYLGLNLPVSQQPETEYYQGNQLFFFLVLYVIVFSYKKIDLATI